MGKLVCIPILGAFLCGASWFFVPSSNTFSPTSLSNLKLWADGADTATINGGSITGGGTVTAWTDKSGTSNNATPTGTITWNATGINGKGTMTFTGSQYFALANDYTGSDVTLFFVTKLASLTSQGFFGKSNCTGGCGNLILFGVTPTFSLFDAGIDEADWNVSLSTGTPYIFSAISNSTSGSSKGYVNGVLQTLTGTGGGTYSFDIQLIGNRSPTTSYWLSGEVGEAIMYGSNLSDADHTKVINYLKAKWGI